MGGTAQVVSNFLNCEPLLEDAGRNALLSGGFAGLSYSLGAAASQVNSTRNGVPGFVRASGNGPFYDLGRRVPPAWFGSTPPITTGPLRSLPPVNPMANALGNSTISVGESLIAEGGALVPEDE